MRPVRLKLSNFLSYRGEHTVDFDGVTLAALIGPNGSGKSSLIDAVRFSLFGHTRGGSDGVITQGEQACRVEFEFALGEEMYLVSRQRSRKGAGTTLLSLQMRNGHEPIVLDGKSVAETQRRIEDALHLTDDLFTVTACANQGNVAAFSQAKPAARKQVLSEILDLVAWERRADVARQLGRDVAAQLEADRSRHAALQATASEVDALREQIAQIEATQGDVARQRAATETELAQSQETKESLLRDREADRARRKSLDELSSQAQRTKTAIGETTTRLSQLEKAASGKAALLDGIHSGLVKPGARGVFFYFDAGRPEGGGRYHFWKYYDLANGTITDNRYIIASLIACSPDTPRVVADVPIFEIQEKVIADILQGHETQQALTLVPKALDPFQQTVATTLQGFMSHPGVDRKRLMNALRYLTTPLPGAQIKDLRKAYQSFNGSRDPAALLDGILQMAATYGRAEESGQAGRSVSQLTRDDLHLVCFDMLSS